MTEQSTELTDAAPWHATGGAAPIRSGGFARTSQYIAMGDGVRLASDLYLPSDPQEGDGRVPAILILTPYTRSLELTPDAPPELEALQWDAGMWGPGFARHGYAVLVVEMRGAAASFGVRGHARASEQRDDVDLVDWIVAQPWSNGFVGATGISAPGLAAVNLLTAKHPAVRAVAPLWTAFDMYASTHPGGVVISTFVNDVGDASRLLDQDRILDLLESPTPAMTKGIRGLRPVDEDHDRSLLAAALRDHEANVYIDRDVVAVTYRDEQLPMGSAGQTLAAVSPSTMVPDLEASGAAIYSYAGWYDGAFCLDAVTLHQAVRNPGSRLLVGPWGHGGHFHDSPWTPPGTVSAFGHAAELAGFFDRHLRPGPEDDAAHEVPPVRYFTLGREEWRDAQAWPPPATPVRLYPASGGTLSREGASGAPEPDPHPVDFSVTTGRNSRYTRSAVHRDYGDLATADRRRIVYDSEPLEVDTEVTGHALASLVVELDREDGVVHLYLEDVAPDGAVRMVTEGLLRGLFRQPVDRTFVQADATPVEPGVPERWEFPLLPVSWLYRAGHRIRIAIAGADADNFPRVPAEGEMTITIHRSPETYVELPVVALTES